MTKEELIEKLKIIIINKDDADPELDHAIADQLLLEFINDEEVTRCFEDIKKWYA
ncbi:MAG: hypothetical protein K2Q18_06110 [Bdellovibrionales bacterium]|nr:hypothetical protein [Bdellovibrionales bacterium]